MKQLTSIAKIVLFLTAYTPLGAIYLITDYKEFRFPFFEHGLFSLILLPLMIVMLWLLYKMITYFERKESEVETMDLVKVSNMNSEILSYIFSYLLPFLDFPEERRFLVTLFLLAIVGVLYTRSDMISINPVLSTFGYNIIKVEWKQSGCEKTREAMLVSKLDYYKVKEAGALEVVQMHNELYLVKGAQND